MASRWAGLALAALLMAALGGGNACAWRLAFEDGSLAPTLCAIAGMWCLYMALPGLLALVASGRGRR